MLSVRCMHNASLLGMKPCDDKRYSKLHYHYDIDCPDFLQYFEHVTQPHAVTLAAVLEVPGQRSETRNDSIAVLCGTTTLRGIIS